MRTVNHIVNPDDPEFEMLRAALIGCRTVVRYLMVPMRFEKHVYQINSYKMGEAYMPEKHLPPLS